MIGGALRAAWQRTSHELSEFRRVSSDAGAHDLRVALRRLLATLELAETLGSAPPDKVVKSLRTALSSLSPLRDLEVEQKKLDELAPNDPWLGELAGELGRRRHVLANKLARKLGRVDADRIRAAIEHAAATLEGLPAPGLARIVAVAGVAARYTSFDARRRAVTPGDHHTLHKARLALKKYRYAVESALPLLPSGASRTLAAIKELQDELGAIQDLSVLIETVKTSARDQRPRPPEAAAVLEMLERDRRHRIDAATGTLMAQAAARPPTFSEIFA